jgi:hypothetical protein
VILQGDVRQSVQSGVSLHPIVRFEGLQQLQTMVPRDFEYDENADGQCSFRRQIPLTLAWALSIHKPQGMSITNLEVTCEDVWKEGQIYVALSRGRTLQGLAVHSLGRDGLCRADAKAVAFYAACEQGCCSQDRRIHNCRHEARSHVQIAGSACFRNSCPCCSTACTRVST